MSATPMRQIISRRHMLGVFAAGAGAAVLAACGGTSEATETAFPKMTMAPTAAATTMIATRPASAAAQSALSGSVIASNVSMPTLVIEAVDFGCRSMGSISAGVTSIQLTGTYLPVRGFGKVYSENPAVPIALGLALAPERGYQGSVQSFERGMLVDDSNDSLVFVLNGIANTWDSAPR